VARSRTDDLELARRYLLRQLDDTEQARAEERAFLDPAFFEQVEIAEDDLIEEYAHGDAPGVDRTSLLEFMKDPDRQQRAQLARELRQRFGAPAARPVAPVAAPASPRATPWWTLAAAAGVVLCAGAALYSVAQATAVRREMVVALELRDAELRALSARLSAPLAGPEASLLVEPGDALRGSGSAVTTVTVPPTLSAVAIHLLLPQGQSAERYDVTIQRADGAQVWGRVVTPVAGPPPAVIVAVPPVVLQPGDYTARLATAQGGRVAGYRFRVVGG
jgi:hypothetical protein